MKMDAVHVKMKMDAHPKIEGFWNQILVSQSRGTYVV